MIRYFEKTNRESRLACGIHVIGFNPGRSGQYVWRNPIDLSAWFGNGTVGGFLLKGETHDDKLFLWDGS